MSGALQIDMPEGHFQSRAVLVTGAHFDMRASHLLMAKAAWESVRPAEPAAEVAVGTSTVRVAESDHPPRPSSPFEVFVPVRGCAVEHPVTVPVSPAPPAARTRTEPSRVADDGALLIVPPSVPVDVTEDDVTEDALLPRAPAAAVQVRFTTRRPPFAVLTYPCWPSITSDPPRLPRDRRRWMQNPAAPPCQPPGRARSPTSSTRAPRVMGRSTPRGRSASFRGAGALGPRAARAPRTRSSPFSRSTCTPRARACRPRRTPSRPTPTPRTTTS